MLGKRVYCRVIYSASRKRKFGDEICINGIQRKRAGQTLWGCNICDVALCTSGDCWVDYHRRKYSNWILYAFYGGAKVQPIRYVAWDPCLVQHVSAAEGIAYNMLEVLGTFSDPLSLNTLEQSTSSSAPMCTKLTWGAFTSKGSPSKKSFINIIFIQLIWDYNILIVLLLAVGNTLCISNLSLRWIRPMLRRTSGSNHQAKNTRQTHHHLP